MGYTCAAYRLFPRYRLDDAIRIQVEKIGDEKLTSLEVTRALILNAGRQAFTSTPMLSSHSMKNGTHSTNSYQG
jgi:hypothetical protein